MSGIAGIVNTDGAPVDPQLLSDMTESLRFRGPDAMRTWIDGHVGFGHTLFATTEEAWRERQPCTIDGDVWIVADARVDARDDLVRTLDARGRTGLNNANDAELILHAYGEWGEACVDHLLGDFAFAVWDRPRRRLFCARDQFGVKPFYYALRGNAIVFSNTLDCVRRHPLVSDRLNDLTIADFLLFYYNQNFDTTAFADIQRLPGGHTLTWTGGQPHVRRYWTLPVYGELRYRRRSDYVDRFREVLHLAVRDRLRTRRVGILMSGGLDSTAVAATAHQQLSASGEPFTLRAHTVVYDRLIPDEERHYAGLAAGMIGLPIDYLVADDRAPYERSGDRDVRTPEPIDEPFLAMIVDHYRRVAAYGRVALTGSDGDTLLDELPARHFSALRRSCGLTSLLSAWAAYAWTIGARPPMGIRTTFRRWTSRGPSPLQEFPDWINEEFAARLDLRSRWQNVKSPTLPAVTRPRAVWVLSSPQWSYLFESRDPGVTGVPLELRHPLTDLRLVEYLLSIPASPWCMKKTILREAMRGLLPEPVRLRKKSPLAGDPLLRHLERPGAARPLDSLARVPALFRYANRDALPSVAGQGSSHSVYWILRLLSLNDWLDCATHADTAGVEHGQEQAQPIG